MFVLAVFIVIALALTAASGWLMGLAGDLIPEKLHTTISYGLAVALVYLTGYSVLNAFGYAMDVQWADRLITALALVAAVPFIERVVHEISGRVSARS
jgi:hypothetical protein